MVEVRLEGKVLIKNDPKEPGRRAGLDHLPIAEVQRFARAARRARGVEVNELEFGGFKSRSMGGGPAEAPSTILAQLAEGNYGSIPEVFWAVAKPDTLVIQTCQAWNQHMTDSLQRPVSDSGRARGLVSHTPRGHPDLQRYLSEISRRSVTIYDDLTPAERSVVAQMQTGKIGLNHYLSTINQADDPSAHVDGPRRRPTMCYSAAPDMTTFGRRPVSSTGRAVHAEHQPVDVPGGGHRAGMARADRPQQQEATDSPSRQWLTDRYHILWHTISHSRRYGVATHSPGLRVCVAPACQSGTVRWQLPRNPRRLGNLRHSERIGDYLGRMARMGLYGHLGRREGIHGGSGVAGDFGHGQDGSNERESTRESMGESTGAQPSLGAEDIYNGVSLIFKLRAGGAMRGSCTDFALLQDTILPIFLRLGTTAQRISDIPVSGLLNEIQGCTENIFSSLSSAHLIMVAIAAEGMIFQRTVQEYFTAEGYGCAIPPAFKSKQEDLQKRLAKWHRAYTNLVNSSNPSELHIGVTSLLLSFHAATLIITAVSTEHLETAYDALLP
ncbi:hypothetical protein CNMCM5623_004801 [Aspergillus felis]|uniref:Uncharacterized protein n=1 Tax=Aspergillus felis TaxID=1287682 RepID=A0A8H6QHA0_9EURO|nr:hypothetical protein CNMCM5623_004801 [Aspergillus felis]